MFRINAAIALEKVAIRQFGVKPHFQPYPKTRNYRPRPMAAF